MRLVIWGDAVPWKAPRVVRRGPKILGIKPESVTIWQQEIRRQIVRQLPPRWQPFDGPVRLDVVIARRPPASFSGRKRALAVAGELRPTTRPDRSNILKALEDALGPWPHDGAGPLLYHDDSQICAGETTTVYADRACVILDIRPVDPIDGAQPAVQVADEIGRAQLRGEEIEPW